MKHNVSGLGIWAIERIARVCTMFPGRTAGSDAVKGAARELAKELSQYADEVTEEEFVFHPSAWPLSIPIQCIPAIASIVAWWLSVFLENHVLHVASVVLFLVWVPFFFCEYWFYWRTLDPLFPKKTGLNVIARRKARGEARKRLVLCAHLDAAYEMRFFKYMRSWMIGLNMVLADAGIVIFGIVSVLGLFVSLPEGFVKVYYFILIATVLGILNFTRLLDFSKIVPGASDNLSGCYVAASVMKYVHENGVELPDTELCVLLTDGEECGLRGAMAYAEHHKDELAAPGTAVIAVDTIYNMKDFMVYQRGINFTQKNSPRVCSLLRKAAADCRLDLPDTPFYPGGTDAEAFSRYGIEAAALCATPHDAPFVYHTTEDVPEKLDPECIETASAILLSAVQRFAQEW